MQGTNEIIVATSTGTLRESFSKITFEWRERNARQSQRVHT